MSKHYDVVVVGAGLGALATAVLLARRSWRVLVVGHGHRPWRYTYDGLPLGRRPFTLLAGQSPAWTRVLVEIAQSQTWTRRARPTEPAAQVLGPRLRFDVAPAAARFAREIEREFPAVRRVVDDLVADVTRTNAAADAAFSQDVLWPPGGFWERRETMRVLSSIPRADGEGDVLAELAPGHPYRRVAEVPAQFSSHLAGALPPFALARLHGAFVRGVLELPRGEDDVAELFIERIKAHGGEVAFHERVQRLVTKGNRVTFVELADEGARVGVQFVVGEMPALDLTGLANELAPSRRALAAVPTVTPRARRFVVSIVVKKAGLPELLARDAFLLGGPEEPPVRLQMDEVASGGTSARASRPDAEPLALLVAETLLPEGAAPRAFRERVLRIVEAHLPFVERHYVVVDSPHDGRPLWDYRSGRRVPVERALLRSGGGVLEAEPMVPQIEVSPAGLHGLAGDGLRTPMVNGFVVGPSVMPALGQEGELLSAWGAARIITRTDRRKEKMRREMWSKVEIG